MNIIALNGENTCKIEDTAILEKTKDNSNLKNLQNDTKNKGENKDENTLCQLEIEEDAEKLSTNSKETKLGNIFGDFLDKIFGKDKKDDKNDDKNTKDGKIGPTKQGRTGDCWLLSGINALSYSEEGRKLIENALEYEDGYTIVHLKGFGDVVVKDDELDKGKLSSGDEDMRIFELAMEKAITAIKSGDCAIDPDAPDFMQKDELNSTIEGGNPMFVMYLLTGKYGEKYGGVTTEYAELALNTDRINEILNEFSENNGKDKALSATMDEEAEVEDINGNKVTLAGPHAYAVKEVKDGVVVLTNPWNSGEDIKISQDTFINTFDGVQYLDLSENNSEQNYISRTYKIDKDGNKIFTFDRSNRENYVDDNMQPVHYSKEEISYSDDGKIVKRVFYNEDGTRSVARIFDPETGKQSGYLKYSKDGKKAICNDFDENTYRLADCDEYGNPTHWYYIDDKKDVEKLESRRLLDYSQFNADEIHFLLKLTDEEWQKAEEYLSKKPDADYSEIMQAIKNSKK